MDNTIDSGVVKSSIARVSTMFDDKSLSTKKDDRSYLCNLSVEKWQNMSVIYIYIYIYIYIFPQEFLRANGQGGWMAIYDKSHVYQLMMLQHDIPIDHMS